MVSKASWKVSKGVLLSSCGQKAFKLIETLIALKKVNDGDITYDSIKDSVIAHLQAKHIRHYERHLLYSMVQKGGKI